MPNGQQPLPLPAPPSSTTTFANFGRAIDYLIAMVQILARDRAIQINALNQQEQTLLEIQAQLQALTSAVASGTAQLSSNINAAGQTILQLISDELSSGGVATIALQQQEIALLKIIIAELQKTAATQIGLDLGNVAAVGQARPRKQGP